MNKRLLLILPVIIVASLFVASQAVPRAHANPGTGLVCITTSTTATSCPTSPPTIGPLTVGSTFSIGVFVSGSDAMAGFDIYISADPSYLSPTSAVLSTLIASPTLTSICVNGLSTAGSCSPNTGAGGANGPGVVEVTTLESSGSNECGGISPCSGMAFIVTYSVIGAIASTPLSYPSAAFCNPGSIAASPSECVLVDDSTGTTLFETAQGATVTQTVTPDPTTTAVSCVPSSVQVGTSTTCTATVTDTATTSPTNPGGTVTFSSDGTGTFGPSTAMCSLSNGAGATGVCNVSYTPTAVGSGTHNIGAIYGGDGTHESSTATAFPLTVTSPVHATTTSVGCDASIAINQPSTCTATVADTDASPTDPTGSVTFSETGIASGSFSNSNPCTLAPTTTIGTSTCTADFLSSVTGTASVTATYSGDSSHSSSSNPSVFNIIVTLRDVSVTPVCTTPVTVGSPSTCTVTVTDTSPGTAITPTGTVAMSSNSSGSFTGTCDLSGTGATATCSVIYTPTVSGTHTITADYPGDTNHVAVINTFDLIVTGKVTPTITSLVTPASIAIGGSASDLASLTGGASPTGTVTYAVYSDSACTVSVFTSANVALGTSSGSFTPTTVGTYYWIASYSGDTNNNAVATLCGAAGETLTATQATPTISSTVTPSTINIGGSAADLATLTGGFSPTGTVTYTAYSDSACTTLVFTSSGVALGTSSAAFTPTATGTYYFIAAYGGDANNVGVSTSCGATGETLTVSAKPTPTITSTVTPSSFVIGGSATDLATLTGGSSPSGTVTYTAYSDSACTVSVFTDTEPIGTASKAFTPAAAGTYSFIASYSGDANNAAVSTNCGATGESLTVNKSPVTLTTVIQSATGSVTTIVVGTAVTDQATLSGGFPSTGVSGTVSYFLFTNGACTGTGTAEGVVTIGSGGLVGSSNSVTPVPVGTYSFQASYSGDSNNNGFTSNCEVLTVTPATPTVTTAVSPSSIVIGNSATDLATVTGFNPTGTVTYTAYSDAACTTLVFTSSGIDLGTPSGAFSPTAVGTYYFVAAYSGDSNNDAAASSCGATGETLAVSMVTPTVTTSVSPSSITLGGSATDLATVTGFNPTGTVTYTAYTDSACTTLVFTSASIAVGTPSSAFTPTALGTYYFVAAYSGDANNNAVTTICGATGETLTVASLPTPTLTTVIEDSTGTAVTTVVVGTTVHDTGTITPTGTSTSVTGTVTYNFYSDGSCSGTTTSTETVTITSTGTVPDSSPNAITAAGLYSYQATYSGDTNNAPTQSSCEPLTTALASPTVGSFVTPSSIVVGQSATDLASLSGGLNPTGTVTYTAYSDAACTTLVFSSSAIALGAPSASFTPTAAGTYYFIAAYSGDSNNNPASTSCGAAGETLAVTKASPTITSVVSPSSINQGESATDLATLTGGFGPTGTVTYTAYSDSACTVLVFTSAGVAIDSSSTAFTPTVPGTYYFLASYSGDVNNNGVSTACGASGETLFVKSLPALLITSTVAPSSITIGSSASDSATLIGGISPTGTITYTAYSDSACTVQVFTDTEPLGTASAQFTPASAGTYYFIASYSGDVNNNPVVSPCGATGETLTVNRASPTVSSLVSPSTIIIGGSASDLASLSGGFSATGTVTYTAYSDAACTAQVFTDSETVGTASNQFAPTTAGTYYFVASYGGDVNNNQATSSCGATGETLTVNKATGPIVTSVTPATITIGGSATDLASSVGGYKPTGTVIYTAYSDSACTVQVFTDTEPLGTASAQFTPTAAGTYYFTASYSGDINNNPVNTACGSPGETLSVNKMTPTVTTAVSPPSITLGGSATDLATVTGYSPAGTVTYAAYSDSACTTVVFTSSNVALGSASAAFTPAATGTYYFVAAYSGDTNNNAVTTACGATGETLTVTPTVQPVLLTFQGYDLDDYCNGVSQLQVFVNGQQVVDIPAGLNHLTGCGDYAPYDNKWINFGPFDISSLVVNGKNNITFEDLNTGDHYGLIRNVLIVQGSTTLLNVPRTVGIYHTYSKTYTFSNPPLVLTSFTVSNTSPVPEQSVTFTATYAGGTGPFVCIFSFGDGHFGFKLGASGSCTVTHDYDYSGTFNAFVLVIGSATSDQVTGHLTVTVTGNVPPPLTAMVLWTTDAE